MELVQHNSSIAIGIDVGQAIIISAISRNSSIDIIRNEYGQEITPCFVVFTENICLVGEEAKCSMNSVSGVKRVLGVNAKDALQKAEKNLCFELDKEDGISINVQIADQRCKFRPQEILSVLIHSVKTNAQNWYLGVKCVKAVIAVPAAFTYTQREALAESCRIAGVQIIDIITDPVAAVIAYGLDKKVSQSLVLIFSLGAGIMEVSVMSVGGGKVDVKFTSGDTDVGGEEFDTKLVRYFVKEFTSKYGKSPCKNALRRLRIACERAKCELSYRSEVEIKLVKFFDGIHFSANLSRALFVELCSSLFLTVERHTKKALRGAGVQPSDIEQVILVGGGTRIPKIKQFLAEYFGQQKLFLDIEPSEVIVRGAAMQAEFLSNSTNATLLSIGLEVSGSRMNIIIPRSTVLPTKNSFLYTTIEKSSITLFVYEGERLIAPCNRLLGVLTLNEFTRDVDGVARIDVTFEIDTFGVLAVTASDLQSESCSCVSAPTSKGCLSAAEVEHIVKYAEDHREADENELKRVEARNAMLHSIENIESDISVSSYLGKMSIDDHYLFINFVAEERKWLDEHPRAKKEVFERKAAELHKKKKLLS